MNAPATIWITGAKGFIGRHLARHLADAGHRVMGLGHGVWAQPEVGAWGLSAWVGGEIDEIGLNKLLDLSAPPDTLYHLAGGGSVGASFADPSRDFDRTVASTAHLLDWLRRSAPDCRVVAVSSAAVYGGGHPGPIAEGDTVCPYSPYGWHKHLMEQLCLAQAANFGLEAVIVRLFSVYGPCLYKQLLWDLCSKFAADPVVLRLGGSGEERRDWIAVSDVARLLELAAKLAGKETLVLNGGTGVPTTVREIAQQVADAWGSRAAIEFTGLARPGDPFSLVADCRRIRELGFESSQTPQNGIPAYVRWFREYRKG